MSGNAFVYRGRFAPSPTGPLHFGSLIAALASYLDARAHQGEWLIRIEDIDLPRCEAGADTRILKTLAAFGFEWHDEVVYQSRRTALYRAAFDRLNAEGYLFPCICTRRQLSGGATAINGGRLYDGRCRNGLPPNISIQDQPHAWRIRVSGNLISYADVVQGEQSQRLDRDVGDFVVLRADGLFAYQLAVVVDDHEQHISHVIRGADLLDSTSRQIFLQRLLGYAPPAYAHVPVVVDVDGEKLSKQTLATPVEAANPLPALLSAWHFLGQSPVDRITGINEFWSHAMSHWDLARIPRRRTQKEMS